MPYHWEPDLKVILDSLPVNSDYPAEKIKDNIKEAVEEVIKLLQEKVCPLLTLTEAPTTIEYLKRAVAGINSRLPQYYPLRLAIKIPADIPRIEFRLLKYTVIIKDQMPVIADTCPPSMQGECLATLYLIEPDNTN